LTDQGQGNIAFLAGGLWQTVAVSLLAISVSIPLGLLVALPGFALHPAPRMVNRAYVEFIRSIPILPLMLWVYYGLPVLTGINFDPFTAGVLTLVVSDSAFEAEIFRGGLQSIEKGQHEAADALGLSAFDKLWYVVLPQAIRRILPPLGNQFVYVLKMSSLLSVIGVFELTKKANELVVTLYRPLEIYSFLILEYFVLVVIVSAGVRWLERRLAADQRLARR
jgi:polar amino acid transport system permease protein